MAKKVKVAAVQMPFTNDVGANLAVMESALRRAARRRAALAVLPECCLSGYLVPAEKRDWAAIDSGVVRMRELARELGMAVIFGTALKNGSRLPFNSVLAVDGRGAVVARYDKCHLMPNDRDCFTPGKALPKVFRLAGLKVAMQICFDVRFPEPARHAALAGAELIAYSFAGFGAGGWKLPVMEAHLRSRAAENGVFVLGANCAHRVMIVASRVIGPDGLDLAAAKPGRTEEIIAAIEPAAAHRKFLAVRRPDLYGR